jgi:ammonia channel protein AmtB
VWTLVSAYLVFCMQVGFVMLESGFARSRETVNILVEGIADTCICGITFWLWDSSCGSDGTGSTLEARCRRSILKASVACPSTLPWRPARPV